MTYKFKQGQKVCIAVSGWGCGPDTVGHTVTIDKLGSYDDNSNGYTILETKYNTNSYYGGFIGEKSFDYLYKKGDKILINPFAILDTPTNLTLLSNNYEDEIDIIFINGNRVFYKLLKSGIEVSGESIVKIKEEITNLTNTNKTNKMSNIQLGKKTLSSKKTANHVRNIETSLINKEEVFKMLALAEATRLPCLLIGSPGTAKTKTVIEYAKAWLNKDGKMTSEDFANKIYILETDEGTKASEIKGMPDLSKLFTENKYEVAAPIAEAEIVIINEVDKASSAIRNAMLGVMNEKFLFNGKHKIPCKWKLFIATCNEIPKEEKNSPFWDRFMLKHTVNRVSSGELSKYYSKGAREYKEKFNIAIPTKSEIDQVNIPVNKLDKYLEVGYGSSSDRTLTFVPMLTKAVTYIWNVSVDKALVKTAQIMISQTAGSELQNKLMSAEVKTVMSKVDMLQSYKTNDQLELALGEIENLINTYTTRDIMDQSQVEEIELSIQYILENHPARQEQNSNSELTLEEIMSATPEDFSNNADEIGMSI